MLEPDTDSEDEVPHGWEERVTPEGWVYYADHFTKITKWEHPKTNKRKRVAKELPYGWERLEDEDGRTYYVDHVSKRTTYTDPRLAFAVNITEKKGNYQQRFDGSSTTDAVLEGTDLRGKVAIVTGASSGIGLETARALACHGAKVIMACRDTSKTMDVIQSIKKDRDDADLVFMRLDLCSLQSVDEFAEEFASKSWPLHMLILNAAVFALPWQLTEDRIERTFATNHVGHFHLTKMLEKCLLASAPARVVVLSSESHRYPDMEEPTLEKLSPPVSQFWYMTQYNRSKLCNILFSNELNRRLYRRGVTSNSVHPGNMMYTSLSSSSWLMRAAFFLARPFTKSMVKTSGKLARYPVLQLHKTKCSQTKQGAACSVYAAAAPELEGLGGLYFNNCCVCDTSIDGSNPAAAARLWTIMEDLISDRLRARRKEIARGQADNRSRDSSSTISDA